MTVTTMTKKAIQVRVDINFFNNVKKLFPDSPTNTERTRRLNKIVEEILYGKKED